MLRLRLILLLCLTLIVSLVFVSMVNITHAADATKTATLTRTPTITRTPTLTKTPTNTPTYKPCKLILNPTDTPTEVDNPTDVTNTPTDTITPTPCSTLTPSATPNDTQAANTATKEVANEFNTATVESVQATATLLADYKPIDARELKSYSDKHVGEHVIVSGTVANVVSGEDVIQIFVNGNYNNEILVYMADSVSGVYQNDYVTVYGTVEGIKTYDTVAGGTNQEPYLDQAFLKPKH